MESPDLMTKVPKTPRSQSRRQRKLEFWTFSISKPMFPPYSDVFTRCQCLLPTHLPGVGVVVKAGRYALHVFIWASEGCMFLCVFLCFCVHTQAHVHIALWSVASPVSHPRHWVPVSLALGVAQKVPAHSVSPSHKEGRPFSDAAPSPWFLSPCRIPHGSTEGTTRGHASCLLHRMSTGLRPRHQGPPSTTAGFPRQHQGVAGWGSPGMQVQGGCMVL